MKLVFDGLAPTPIPHHPLKSITAPTRISFVKDVKDAWAKAREALGLEASGDDSDARAD